MSFEQEVQITRADLARTKEIVSLGEPALIETGVFHLAYLKRLVDKEKGKEKEELYLKLKKEYFSLFSRLPHLIIFIDTKPEVSWRRRRRDYRARVEKTVEEKGGRVRELMRKYKDNRFELYGYFKKLYKDLPLQKVLVENNYRKEKRFLKKIEKLLQATLRTIND